MKLCGAALALLACALLAPLSARSLDPGERAPSFTLPDAEGRDVRLEDHRGSVVLVNIWAQWCEPCKEELPHFEALYQKYRERGFVILAVNIDAARQQAKARALRDRLGLSFPVLYDPQKTVPKRFEPPGMPASYLLDREGIVRHVQISFEAKDVPKIEAAIRKELARAR